ncbi:hypothetical protein [Enterococcus innesii]|nr:hypothetical protein [Enterococcus innesii]
MAKFSNVFEEAKRRYRDFKARGFVPPGGGNAAWQDFIAEVAAENKGQYHKGIWTKNAYKEAYGVDVDYFESTSYADIKEQRLDNLLSIYRELIRDIYDINDFWDLAAKYGNGRDMSFKPSDVNRVDSLDGLIDHASAAMNIEPYLFRNKTGRRRSEESSMMETYHDTFVEELGHLIDEMSEQKIKFKY